MPPAVNFTAADGIGHLELNRPEAANALNMTLAEGLLDAATQAGSDDAVRAVLLTGAGKRFCAGGDIGAISSADDHAAFVLELATAGDTAVQALEILDRPVVAAVHGAVAGAGLGIMLAADIIVAAPETKFVFAYPEIGLTPDCGVSVALPRAMGLQRALAFALSGSALTAQQALAQGLITEIAEEPEARATEIAQTWASKAASALGTTRQLLRQSNANSRAAHGARESDTISQRIATDEAQTLIEVFLSR